MDENRDYTSLSLCSSINLSAEVLHVAHSWASRPVCRSWRLSGAGQSPMKGWLWWEEIMSFPFKTRALSKYLYYGLRQMRTVPTVSWTVVVGGDQGIQGIFVLLYSFIDTWSHLCEIEFRLRQTWELYIGFEQCASKLLLQPFINISIFKILTVKWNHKILEN
jgi:hypothetical protein